MKNLTLAFAVNCILLMVFSPYVSAKKETFFGCDRGFQYETKKDAARCIKQQKQSFRPPLKCLNKQNRTMKLRLVVDSDGVNDLCEAVTENRKLANKKPLQLSGKRPELQFAPSCTAGYKLQTKKGKDVCAKGNAEQIKPPTKKVLL